ncbi:MAG TPA: MBL fold metallo-hydrolase [Gemmatimonadaceae bacterium]|nr:MBL fold metallo-hydrolase [Gemmatimonadaceae bacterium]
MKARRSRFGARRRERLLASPRFDGRVFRNTFPVSAGLKPGVERPTMRDFLCPSEDRVPSSPLPLVDPVYTWMQRTSSGLRVTWLGHSTLLIEIDGARLLTDPVWSERASPLPFAGPKRFHPPPAALDALPPLDAVILSHDHYDHLDRVTVRTLARMQPKVPFITSLGVGERLERWGVPPKRVTELDWWDTADVKGVTVTAGPAQHFSGRGIRDRNTTLWSSMHLRGPRHSFFFGADTGLTPEYSDIAKRLGPFDMVALEIGAYHPSWGDIHMGPVNALRAYEMLGSGAFLPIHWATFNLAIHPWSEPAETVYRNGTAAGVPLVMPRLGAPTEPSHFVGVDPWWRSVTSAAPEPIADARAPESLQPLERMAD